MSTPSLPELMHDSSSQQQHPISDTAHDDNADISAPTSSQRSGVRLISLPLSSFTSDSHPSTSSEFSSASSPSSPAFAPSSSASPIATPASSGAPSPIEELEHAEMLKSKPPAPTPVPKDSKAFNQWRPTSHFLGPHGWMNDPCGPSFDPRTGLYHLWYQWNPNASTWGSICWGHAYSSDMVHWTSRPDPVIRPGSNHDSEGVFTGCVLHRSPLGTPEEAVESGEMTAIYTAVSQLPIHHTLPYNHGSEKVVLSTSSDGGASWMPHGVVLNGPPEELEVISWRDPYIAPWPLLDAILGRHSSNPGLYALIAGGIKDTTPTTFAYSLNPNDLSQWTYLGTLADVGRNLKAAPYGVDLGKNWEVANFFSIPHPASPASSAEYLLINVEGCTEPGPARAAVYMQLDLGKTKVERGEVRLQPARVGRLDHGCLYAASSFHDEKKGRRIMWGWITEDDLPEEYYNTQGWAGLISLPRELFHHPTSPELGIRPAEEVYKLRDGAQRINFTPSFESLAEAAQIELGEAALGSTTTLSALPISGVTKRSYEVETSLSASQPGLVLAHNGSFSTRTLVYVSALGELVVDRTHSAGKISVLAKDIAVNTSTLRAPLSPTATKDHKLRLFMDNSVLEVFVDDLIALSTRIYPDEEDVRLSVLLHPGSETAGEVTVWHGLNQAIIA